MHPFLSSSMILTFFLTTAHAVATPNLIRSTCKTVARTDPNVGYGFCATSLEAVPTSQTASLPKLGSIAIRLVRRNVTDTHAVIKQLLKNKKWDRYSSLCLHDCLELFSDAIPSIKEASGFYDAQRFDDANVQISAVMSAATTCEDGFKEGRGAVSPLTERNDDVFKLSVVALAIMSMVSE